MTDPIKKALTDHEAIQRRIRREQNRQIRALFAGTAAALRGALRAAAARLSAGSAAFR